jgi:hypothetical protein
MFHHVRGIRLGKGGTPNDYDLLSTITDFIRQECRKKPRKGASPWQLQTSL